VSKTTVHHRACNLCEAICGIEIEVEGDRITAIRGDADDPLSRGHICPKAVALQDIQNDPDRLRHPQLRTAGGWRRIGWEEAFDLAARRLLEVRDRHGRDAVAVYLGNPNVHSSGALLFGPPLLRALETRNRYSATSVDQLPHHLAAYLMFGHMLLLPIPDLERTEHLLILGANPVVSNGSLMTAPGMKKRLAAIRRRGGRVVVIDPRRTETAKAADEHHFVRPGTDAFLLAALLATIFEEGLDDPGYLGELADGWDAVRRAVARFPPERVAPAVGIGAGEIRRLARDFAAAPSAACYGRIGVSVQEFGGLCQWLINLLNLATGNLDRPGGAMFTRPAVDLVARRYGGGSFGRWWSRVRGLPEFAGELPSSVLAEEILTPGEGQVRALVTAAGNPVLSTPNGARLDEALGGLDFMLSIDFYLNETTRHAHLILPPTPPLERDHYDLAFHVLAVRNTARYSQPLFPAAPDARHDWQILHELRRRVERNGSLGKRFERWVMGRLGPAGMLAAALRQGPYGAGFNPFRRGLGLRRLKRAPHGVDLGPLEPCLARRLKTPDRRIHLAPEPLLEDVDRLDRRLGELAEPPPLVLVGRRHVRSNNSWMHNYRRLMRGADRCTLLMHPEDADRCGVAGAERVAVSSRVGRIEAPLEVSDEVMPGVVSLPHGWGHDRPGVRLETAGRHPGVSVNDLTDDQRVDAASGNAVLNGVPVTVEPLG